MNGSTWPHELSLVGFEMDSEAWATESRNHVSLSKYSICLLLKLAVERKLKGDDLALYLRAAALTREHSGASQFIFWSFADTPPEHSALDAFARHFGPVPGERHVPEALHGIGAPTGMLFQNWLAEKSSGASLGVPTWDLPLLADYADEFLHLSNDLRSLSQEFDSTFRDLDGSGSMTQALDAIVYFDNAPALISLATKVLKRAGAEHRENPVDLLLQAFEGIGLVTRRTHSSEDVAKGTVSTSKNLTSGKESGE